MLVVTLAKLKQDDLINFGYSETMLKKPRRVLPGQGRLLEEGWSAALDFPSSYLLSPLLTHSLKHALTHTHKESELGSPGTA